MTDAKMHDNEHGAHGMNMREGDQGNPYASLALMALLSFGAMFVLMYAMVDRLENAAPNLNQAYMAALMAAPMVLIELALMRHMYKNKSANFGAIGISLVVFALSFLAIRSQGAIGNDQFLRSMIPHHASAVLMCEKAHVTDAEIQRLCQDIIAGQTSEIAQMKQILRRPH